MKKRILLKSIAAFLAAAVILGVYGSPVCAYWTEAELALGQNLLKNPGFEDGSAAWSLPEGAALDAGAFTGKHSMLLRKTGISQQLPPLEAGEYQLSLVARITEQTPQTALAISLSNRHFQSNQLSEHWQRICQTVALSKELASNAATLLISATGPGSSGVYLDDVSLVKTGGLPPQRPVDPAENIVKNGSFEASLDGWNGTGGNVALERSTLSHSGLYSLHVENMLPTVHNAVYQLPSGLPEGEYEVTAYLSQPGPTHTLSIGIDTKTTLDLMLASPRVTLPVGEEWVKASFVFWMVPGETHYFCISGNNDLMNYTREVYVDDVSVIRTHCRAGELLENGEFEARISGWDIQDSATVFTTDSDAHTGKSSAFFSCFASEPLGCVLSQDVPITRAGLYTLSAYLKPEESLVGTGAVLALEAAGSNGAYLGQAVSSAVYDASKGWQRAEVTLNVPEGAVSLTVKIGGRYCTGAFYADTVGLKKN